MRPCLLEPKHTFYEIDVNDCSNYREISISSCICKLFTSLLQKRHQIYLDDNNFLNDFQAGFRPDYRTTDYLFTPKTLINKYVYKNKTHIYATFVDVSKTFESVRKPALYKQKKTITLKDMR